jgi:pimeloyl-ACP methyl ester carboxylesterase
VQATRWPEKETVADASQGVQLATMQETRALLGSEYDFGRLEVRLNTFPHFVTKIAGRHSLHPRPFAARERAPVMITHGWPGSIVEMLNVVGPLTDATAHGGDPSDGFDVVIPSMPGYGFSGKPTGTELDPVKIADWFALIKRLRYERSWRKAGTGAPRSPTR